MQCATISPSRTKSTVGAVPLTQPPNAFAAGALLTAGVYVLPHATKRTKATKDTREIFMAGLCTNDGRGRRSGDVAPTGEAAEVRRLAD
jgi:hypothetical protein